MTDFQMNPIRKLFLSSSLILFGLVAVGQAVDLGAYKGCAATDADFKVTQIYAGPTVTSDDASNGTLKLAFVAQTDGTADVYFVQKQGTVKRYNGKTGTVDSLGTIAVDHKAEYGLVGIAAPRDFLKNPVLYFMYSFIEPGNVFTHRISRFKMAAGLGSLDMASEKILLKIVRKSVSWHTSGSMVFDDYDDLYISVGDNQQTETGPGNTADLRGGILRIHPDDSPKGYSVPKGNFGEFYSALYKSQGNADFAAQYADTAKVKPEIYVKGTRNAYTIAVDPVRRWLVWGDVGPDQGKISEENNLVKRPYFTGWPYFAGEQDMGGVQPYDLPIPKGSTRETPVNNLAGLLGVKQLPPVRDPIFKRSQGCAMTGPIFRYDGAVKSASQFPPQLNRKWLVSGCDGYGFHLMTLDSAGDSVLSNTKIFNQFPTQTLVDLKQGPDGALYYISWNKGLYRIDYTGTCKDQAFVPEKTGCAVPGASNYDANLPKAYNDPRLCTGISALASRLPRPDWMRVDRNFINVDAPGMQEVEILDMRGRMVYSISGEGPMAYRVPALPAPALYQVRVKTALGTLVRSLSLVDM
ncbi:MAG: soluble aldose sugar dehydrogenase YliI [Fibrobacteres bacterium]|nr:soluble aldose sugar dehydrogenase YliI [Fibrobacterota bacterium]